MAPERAAYRETMRANLRGFALACWRKPHLACHADVGHSGRAPDVLAVDRGLSSRANERAARQMGLRQVTTPGAGTATGRE